MANQPGSSKPTYRRGMPLRASDLQRTNSAIPKNILAGGGGSVRTFGENIITQSPRPRETRDWRERFRIINDYGDDIPPFSICEIVDTDYGEDSTLLYQEGCVPTYIVTRPTANDIAAFILVGAAGIDEIDADADSTGDTRGKGWGSLDYFQGGAVVAYEGTAPGIGDTVGPTADSFKVTTGGVGLLVMGVDTASELCFVRPYGASGGSGALDVVQVIEAPGVGPNAGTVGVKSIALTSDPTSTPNFIQTGVRRVVTYCVFA